MIEYNLARVRGNVTRTHRVAMRADVSVHPFRDGIAAMQRREGIHPVETTAEPIEPRPIAGDLARCDGRQRGERPLQERTVRLDPPLQAPRGQLFPQRLRSISGSAKRLVDFGD